MSGMFNINSPLGRALRLPEIKEPVRYRAGSEVMEAAEPLTVDGGGHAVTPIVLDEDLEPTMLVVEYRDGSTKLVDLAVD